MSESHKRYLPVIKQHVQQMGWGDAHIEAQLGRNGERCDVWARAVMPIVGGLKGWTSDVEIDLWAGMTSVHEFKASVADLRADPEKPWRRRDRRALGDHRFIWLHLDGQVRPEHVDEDRHYGWGVVAFNESGYSVCRPSRRFACAFYDTINLISELKDREKLEAMSRQREKLLGVASGIVQGAASVSVPAAPVSSALEDLVAEYLTDGPGTTAMITRFLREKHGRKFTPAKLIGALRLSKRFVVPDSPGGSWSLRGEGVSP